MIRYTNCIFILFYVMICISLVSCNIEEDCESAATDIHVTKEEYDEMGRLIRSCTGEVKVNKCEGMCNSQVQPSVISGTGFLKECFCCRENYLRERYVMLTHCYDPDGLRINSETMGAMEIKLREPEECKCYKCGDYN